MKKKKRSVQDHHDSFEDVLEFQNNALNPGHYVGTGRVPPTVSSPGNAMPLVIMCLIASALTLTFGLCLFFSDVHITSSGLIESPLANKILTLIIFVVIALICLLLAFAYLRRAKQYCKAKKTLDQKHKSETDDQEEWELTCPKCGKSHSVDYSKCPHCHFDYLDE